MDELILRVLSGRATRFEEERLNKWKAEDPANQARIRALALVWELTEPERPTHAHPMEVERLTQSITAAAEARRDRGKRMVLPGPNQKGSRISVRALAPWGAALAAGAAALALGIRSVEVGQPDPIPSTPPVAVALSTQTLRLDDGSFVRLSPGSRLEARFGDHERDVTLEGRAFFAVAPDRGRPFIVRARDGLVSVLGTRFEVSQDDDGIRTVVVEGRVVLATPDGQVEVPRGSVGHATTGTGPTTTRVDDVFSLLDWPAGLLVFHNTALRDVAREVERHFRTPIRVDRPDFGSPRVSASFEEDESFEEVLETLCSVTGSPCWISADSAVIGPLTGEAR